MAERYDALARETELRREAERHVQLLREALDAAPYPSDVQRSHAETLAEENKRLREALRELDAMAASSGWDWRSAKRRIMHVCYAALEEKP